MTNLVKILLSLIPFAVLGMLSIILLENWIIFGVSFGYIFLVLTSFLIANIWIE